MTSNRNNESWTGLQPRITPLDRPATGTAKQISRKSTLAEDQIEKLLIYVGLLTIFMILGLCAIGQEIPGKSKKKWKIGITLMPGLSHKTPSIDYSKYRPPSPSPNANVDMPKLSFAGGFRFIYSISAHSATEISALFIDRGYNYPHYLCLGFECNRQVNPIYYLDIPIIYRYKIRQWEKTNIFIATGIAPSVYLYDGNGLTYIAPDGDRKHAIVILEENYHPVGLSFYGSTKAMVRLSNRLSVEIGPSFQIAMMPFTKDRTHLKNSDGDSVEVGEPYYTYKPYFLGLDISFMLNQLSN